MQDAPGSHPMTTPLLLPVIDAPTDAELVASARAGDAFAFSRLWHRHEASATIAASATPGRADVEQVVGAAASLIAQAVRTGGGPAGATRPYVLAAVREAAATADGRASGPVEGDPPLLAPQEWYADVLPEGMRDGAAVAAAYASLPVPAQEALWLAEIDGRTTAEIAAELGLALASAEGLLVEARTGLDARWADAVAATVPPDSECERVLARRSAGDRATERLRPKVRAHLDACAICRAATGEPAVLARRLTAMLPILVLGGAAGTAFLEATRPGSSAAALEPVPPLDGPAAIAAVVGFGGAAGLAAHPAAVAPASSADAAARTGVASPIAAVAAVRRMPRRRLAAVAATLGGVAAAAAIVTVIALSGPGADVPQGSLEAAGSADVAEQAPGMQPPVVVASELPPVPGEDPDAGTADPAPPADSGAADPGPGNDQADGGSTAPAPDAAPGSPAEPDSSTPPSDGTTGPIVAPGTPGDRDPASAPGAPGGAAPIDIELSRPQANGWRTLTLTGAPDAAYTVSSGGTVLYTGVLGPDGSAELAVRGSVANLTAQYGSLALTAAAEPRSAE